MYPELAAFFPLGAAVAVPSADDLPAAEGTLSDFVARETVAALAVDAENIGDLPLGDIRRIRYRHLAAVDLLERLSEFGGLVLVHADVHSRQRLNEVFARREYRVDVLFQLDIAALSRVVYDRRAGRLGAQLKPLEHGVVLGCFLRGAGVGFGVLVVFGVLLLLSFFRQLLAERILQVIVQRLDRVVLRRGCLFLARRERDIDVVVLRKTREHLVLRRVVVIFRPSGLDNDHALEDEILQPRLAAPTDADSQLCFVDYTVPRAEDRRETAHHRAVDLRLIRRQL